MKPRLTNDKDCREPINRSAVLPVFLGVSLLTVVAPAAGRAQDIRGRVKSVEVVILSAMLTDHLGVGEWGFSALVEADGHRILFDLFEADAATLDWTAAKLGSMELSIFLGAHCTGIEPVYQLRSRLGLIRANCTVGAVGARFSLRDGLDPGALARYMREPAQFKSLLPALEFAAP